MEKEEIAVELEFTPEQAEYLSSVIAREEEEGNNITISDLLALYAKSVRITDLLIAAIQDADVAVSA